MVIELSEVQFGQKSYAWFEIISMISDQNCSTRGSITTLLHPFWNRSNTGIGQFKFFLIDAVLTLPYIVVKRKVRFRKGYLIQKFLNCVVLIGHPFELKTFLLRLIPFQNSNHWASDSTVGEVHYEVHMTRVPHTAGISNVGSVMPCK